MRVDHSLSRLLRLGHLSYVMGALTLLRPFRFLMCLCVVWPELLRRALGVCVLEL